MTASVETDTTVIKALRKLRMPATQRNRELGLLLFALFFLLPLAISTVLYLREGTGAGWRTADRKPVKNVDLWQRLDEAQARHKVTWAWIKGHNGHPENERADELARTGMAPFK